MKVVTGTIHLYEEDHADRETKAEDYDAERKEMTEEA